MKTDAITAGAFLRGGKSGDQVREVLYIGPPRDVVIGPANVAYDDPFGGGLCSISTMARWAIIPRPDNWRRVSPIAAKLKEYGLLPEQDGKTLETPFAKERSDLVKKLVTWAFRNTELERIHSGAYAPPGSKVMTPDGATYDWEDVSRVSQEEMRRLMIAAVDKVYTMLTFPDLPVGRENFSPKWQDAKLDENMMLVWEAEGRFGETKRREAEQKLEERQEAKRRAAEQKIGRRA